MDMLGMGVTIVLRDLFTKNIPAIRNASRTLTTQVTTDAQKMNQAWKIMGIGASAMLGGGAILGSLSAIGKAAVEKAADLEVYQRQFISMTQSLETGNRVFKESLKFAAQTPFQIPEIMMATKMLMAYGFQWHEVGKELKVAGDWAALMNVSIKETADVIGRVKSGGYSTAIRYLRSHGVNPALLKQYGAPLDDKMRMKPGSNPDAMVNAINTLLTKDPRFANQMQNFMATIPGMVSNMMDITTIALAGAGERLKETEKGVLRKVQGELASGGLEALFSALGLGLDAVARGVIVILTPIALLVKWLNELSKEHPGFIKWGVAALGVASALLFLGGVILTVVAASQLMSLMGASAVFMSMWGALVGMLPILAVVGGAILLFAAIWRSNFLGVGDTMSRWYNNVRLVLSGVIELFTSIRNGVGTMSMETANSLQSSGLLGATIAIFMAFYRVYQVLAGVWEGAGYVMDTMAMLGSVLFYVLYPVWALVWGVGKLVGLFTDAGNAASPDTYKNLGRVLGVLAGAFLAARMGILLYNGALLVGRGIMAAYALVTNIAAITMAVASAVTKVATGVQWLLNVAMTANPVGAIIMAIVILITVIVLMVKHWKEIHAWIMKAPTWLLVIIAVVMPLIGIPMLIIKYWSPIKNFFLMIGHAIKVAWNATIDWLTDKFFSFAAWFMRLMIKIAKFIPTNMLPESMRIIAQMNPEAVDGAMMRSAWKGSLSTDQQQKLLGTSPAVASAEAGKDTKEAVGKAAANAPKDTRPIQVSSTLVMDGRAVGKAVTTYQREEAADGAH